MARDVAAETRSQLERVQGRIRLARAIRGAAWGATFGLAPAIFLGGGRLLGLLPLEVYVPLACPLVGALAGAVWLARQVPSQAVAATALDQGCESGALFRTILEAEASPNAWVDELRAEVAATLDTRVAEGVALAAPLRVPQRISTWLSFGFLITILVALAPPLQLASRAEDQPQAAMSEADLLEARRLGSRLRRAKEERGSEALERASRDLAKFSDRVDRGQLNRLEALTELGEVEAALQAERARIAARGVVAEAFANDPALREAIGGESLSADGAERAREALKRLAQRTTDPELQASLKEAARALGQRSLGAREAGAEVLRRTARKLPPASWDEQDQRVIDRALETLTTLRGHLSEGGAGSSPPSDVSGAGDPKDDTKPGPGEGDTKPGETKPGEGDTKPGEGDTKPGDTKPGEGDTKPGEGDTKPGEGDTKPGEGDTKPGEGDTKPGEGDTKPGEGDSKPVEGDTKPGEGGTKPGDPGETKPGETKPGETKPGETKPSEPKPGEQTPPGEPKPGEQTPPGEPKPGEQTPPGEPKPGEQTPPGEPKPGEQTPPEDDSEFDPMDIPGNQGPNVPPAFMDMAAKMIKDLDAEDLRGLADKVKDLKEFMGEPEGSDSPQEPPPNLGTPALEEFLKKLSDKDLEKLGKAFADLKESMPPEDMEELTEKAKTPEGEARQPDPKLEKDLRDRLNSMDPAVLERLQKAFPQPKTPAEPGEGAAEAPGPGKNPGEGKPEAQSGVGKVSPGKRPGKPGEGKGGPKGPAGAGTAKPGEAKGGTKPGETKGGTKPGEAKGGTKPGGTKGGTKPGGAPGAGGGAGKAGPRKGPTPGGKGPGGKRTSPKSEGAKAKVGRAQDTGGRVVEVRAQGGASKLGFGELAPAELKREMKRLRDQRVPERYRRMVRSYFDRDSR